MTIITTALCASKWSKRAEVQFHSKKYKVQLYMLKNVNLLLLLLSCLVGCLGEDVPTGAILVKNDSQDSSYNKVNVVGGGKNVTLSPGASTILPKGTTSITFSRRYKDHTKRYEVQCPGNRKKGIVIKLIDVHLNRMPGGCKTIEAGRF